MTQPCGPVAWTVTPPPRAAAQLITRPRVTTATCFPAIATRTCRGTNPSPTDTVEPGAVTAVFFADENGAPQRAFQHHDDMTSGTLPDDVASVARGGPASTRAAISATTEKRYRGSRKKDFGRRRKNHPSSAKPAVKSAASEGEPDQCRAGSLRFGCSPVNHA